MGCPQSSLFCHEQFCYLLIQGAKKIQIQKSRPDLIFIDTVTKTPIKSSQQTDSYIHPWWNLFSCY